MARHAAAESWQDRADRYIRELTTPEPHPGNHHPTTPGGTP